MYIYYFFISFYMGIAVATAPVVSYNYGAQNYGKIKETTRYSFITIAISSVLILAVSYIYGKDIIHLFVGDGNVFSLTWDGLKLFSPVFVVYRSECISFRIILLHWEMDLFQP